MFLKQFLVLTAAVLLLPFSALAQCNIFGIVKSDEGEILIGVNLELLNSERKTVSDESGNFYFKDVAPGEYQLQLSYVGMQQQRMSLKVNRGDSLAVIAIMESGLSTAELSVVASRVGEKDPFSYNNVSKKELEKNNLGQDMPYLLDQTPSVVVSSDAGAGIGYTGIRIRGSDPTRINVSINGVPINDSESQGVWWVNMPDLASSANNIQVQRGLGTSANGAGAFGASINIQANKIEAKPFAILSNSYGSFNSRKHSLQVGSGLIDKHWSFEGRLSQISSDGFIDRASSLLRSYFVSGAYSSDKTLIRANVFSGNERTYQAWGAVPLQYVDTNRTYNPYTYKNEVDNYNQTHYHLHWNQEFAKGFSWNSSLHYTRGFGYYEQYRNGEALSNYGILSADSLVTESDLIRRRWLDNHFYGVVYGLHYNPNKKLMMTLGGAWNRYIGAHFGEVIWARYAGDSELGHEYYRNSAEKLDGSSYLKVNYQVVKKLNLYADLQHRYVKYSFLGFNNDLENVTQEVSLNFFNPKVGAAFFPAENQKVFASLAIGHREPNRSDYTESTPASRPLPERLYDVEAGYSYSQKSFALEANAYFMYYHNQLVLNGQINDVGAFVRSNVPESYRAGLELQGGWKILKGLSFTANASFSTNKITAFTEYVDDWDTGTQEAIEHKNTAIAFSPNIIAGSELSYDILDKSFGEKKDKKHLLSAAWINKYVGKQYIDNTQNDSRSLPGYWVNDLRIRYQLYNTLFRELSLNFMLRNFGNALYSNNAWVYRFRSAGYDPRPDDPYTGLDNGSYYNMIGLYPQAGINFMLGLELKF